MTAMTRIQSRMAELKTQNKTALIPYITAGDPNPAYTVDIMHSLVASGADLIELGVPFSDPMADGPVIQKAVERALVHQVSLRDVLAMVKAFRQKDQTTPVLLMGYFNPIEAMGVAQFAQAALEAGLDGVLTVDMPPEEAQDYVACLNRHHLNCVFLVSPTTPDSRLAAVNQFGSGFVYYVSLKGVTGSAQLDVQAVKSQLVHISQKLDLPIGIGFGIRDARAAYAMAQAGDAVIVGSALVNLVEQHQNESLGAVTHALMQQMKVFRSAIDKADKGEAL